MENLENTVIHFIYLCKNKLLDNLLIERYCFSFEQNNLKYVQSYDNEKNIINK